MAASDLRSCTMAGEAAAEILSQKLEILLCHQERVRCVSVEKLVWNAKKKLAPIQEFFSTRDRPSKSMEWLLRLLRAMYDAEDVIDKFHLREARGRHGALHVVTRPADELVSKCKLWRDLSNLVDKIQDLCQDQYLTSKPEKKPASSFSLASVPGQSQKKVRLTSYRNLQGSYYLRLNKEKKEIMRRAWTTGLLFVTLIRGDQGTGKTFLARRVYREAVYLGVELRIWVRFSDGMEEKELLLEILRQMGKPAREEVKDMSLDEIKSMLLRGLAERKKFLIVLDDVHPSNGQLLESLVLCLWFHPEGHIITTTRYESIAPFTRFFRYQTIELDKLEEDESKKMLASKLYRVPDGPSLSKSKDILNTCGGLPLSLSLLGGLLSYTEKHERKGDELAALLKDCSGLSGIVELSYRRLPVHLKPCFLYMALFPVAYPIPTRRLVRLWLAEGLLDSHCYDTERKPTRLPEDVGEAFILELVERNLIDVVSWRKDGSPKACQMLTSLYDMIRLIAISMEFLHIHDASKSKDGNDREQTGQQEQGQPRETKVRWLAEHTNIVRDGHSGGNPGLNLDHVRSFLSFCLRRGMLSEDISTFLGKMTSKTNYSLLRVLDLEGVYKPSLHGVLHKLVLLRYLGLRSTMLDSIPREVADLHCLETLDIKHTNITSLPSSLWKARNLRHLHLNWFYIDLKKILKACGNNVEALTKLQTLSGLVIGEVKENSTTGHINCLTTLTTLKLFLQKSDKRGTAGQAVADWISSRLTNLQSLTFGVIQEAKPAEEAETAKEAEPKKGAQPGKEAELKKETEPVKETQPAKEAEQAVEAKTQIGELPELSLAQHHELLELYLLGQLKNPTWTRLLPDSLRVLTLSGSKVETDMIPSLGNLLTNLRTLRLLANSFLGQSMTFTAGGFPSLQILKIWKLPQLEEVKMEGGAMPHLKEVEFRHLKMLKTVEGINNCKGLEIIWVISHDDEPAFVKNLKDREGDETYLYVEKDIEWFESTDNGEDNSGDDDAATIPPWTQSYYNDSRS